MAFGKWVKVVRNIAPEFFWKSYLAIDTEISSYFFLLISSDEVAKVFRYEIFISKQRKKERNVKSCDKFSNISSIVLMIWKLMIEDT